ncbi:MAG: LeuA family protein [Desulfobulbaceae bacterium]
MVGLIDTTLREGAQTPGVLFSFAQKIAIGRAVAGVGIEEIEVGTATPLDDDLAPLMAALREMESPPRLALWCRCRDEDIIHAGRLRPDVLSLSLPASMRHIRVRFGKDQAWVLGRLRESVALARDLGIARLSLGIEDASRAESGFVAELIDAAVAQGVGRIRLADTVGVLTPGMISSLVARQSELHPGVEFAFHGHNDFGMATANAVSALDAGAHWVDVTVLGLGERAGCARLEEVAAQLTLVQGRKAYRLDRLPSLCFLVAGASGREIPVNHPLVGRAVFACESGLHVHGLLTEPAVYEPFPPEMVNAKRSVFLGAKSGSRAVAGYLAGLGLHVPSDCLPEIVRHVRGLAARLGRPLLDAEIRKLV